ncbi:type II toxin-antitoxin system RelE/ParE family toxin [Waterburya agarophytonicola K14]|uniref:Type II toxin-antitoxin system RelE/ParE family toxin n=1 Tax=Waterburya agarophytonicola KI4 TaxID=2874699 RepID=A0A964BR19_9CYAN|nr:type II toxin-antitoxin system RelE/ParE family toxin [Waterburya agarophytonicola]MCC0178054.1 type II toxin-antitoxin system RelE/ParE family toxin [Waterburya agarophytonicola KI4]
MTYQISISPSALKDIENIYEWIKVDAPHHATVWFNGLFDVIDSLESMPPLGIPNY